MRAIRRLALLCILLLIFASAPAHAAPPSLRISSVNDRGSADLMPGQRVQILIELRSEELREEVTLSHSAPEGLFLEAASVSAGALAVFDMYPPGSPPPGILWTGEVSATQPINIVANYRVRADATPGDRMLSVSGRAGEARLGATNILRVCCVAAPPARTTLYLPLVRR